HPQAVAQRATTIRARSATPARARVHYPCRDSRRATRLPEWCPATRTTGRTGSQPLPARAIRAVAAASGSSRRRVDFPFPALEQPFALGGRAVLREVVIDDLDRRQRRHLRRQLDVAIGRNREFLHVEADLLALRRQRPVDELARRFRIVRALDDRD